jgi:hypothetical protein
MVGLMLLFPLAIALSAQTVSCTSAESDAEKHYCEADTRYGAHLVRQTSAAECMEGKTWGWDEQGIWVNKGCGGDFALGKAEANPEAKPAHPPIPEPAAKKEERLSCASSDGRRNYCDADLKGATVKLVRQAGPSQCEENFTWGHDDNGIWVDRGCRGEFVVLKQGGGAGDVSCEKSIGKKEARKLVDLCLQISPATHPPCNVANSCVLIKEEIRRSCELAGKDAPKYCGQYK